MLLDMEMLFLVSDFISVLLKVSGDVAGVPAGIHGSGQASAGSE